jgi:GDP-L-fucose synthase
MSKEIVLVTGGSGLIGSAIKDYVNENKKNEEYIFINSKDADLRNYDEIKKIFQKYKPTFVIHLAAKVGGVFANLKYPVEFYNDNILMNNNILKLSHEFNIKKLISCLSTCIFPDKTTYPIDETMIHNGSPHHSNASYAYSKRMIDILNKSYNDEYNCNFTSVIPTNIYGPNDNFEMENAHVIPSLIHKAYLSKNFGKDFIIFGSGKPLRQFIYSKDLAELIIYILKNHNSIVPIILSVDEKDEISIKDIAYIIADYFEIEKSKIKFDETKTDGQYKKTASNKKLRDLLPDYKFTEIKKGIHETCKWFNNNYNTLRK